MRRLLCGLTLFILLLCSRLALADFMGNGSYTANGDGTVTDTSTGLMWQQETAGPMSWEEALHYCEGLTLGGHSDWRLPNVNELQFLVDYSRYNPAIDPELFPKTQASGYWSSTVNHCSPDTVWYVGFGYGGISYGNRGASQDSKYYVRAVRGSSADETVIVEKRKNYIYANGSYKANDDGTVSDETSGLMWQQETAGPMSWEEALHYCEGLTLGEYSDWRLPNVNELQFLVDYSRYNPAIDPELFPKTQASGYWSSTVNHCSPDNAWYVGFDYGGISYGSRWSGKYYVRAVRSISSDETVIVEKRKNYVYGNGSYTANGDGTVTDTSTGLMWQRETAGPMSWEEALHYCEGLTLGGHSDWRLPNVNELQFLVDYSRYNPAIDPELFPKTQASGYWSSTVNHCSPD
ncbi:MAG: DUF1566 domain-containing protein, partial [bacterium]